jgi:hypothetical protein
MASSTKLACVLISAAMMILNVLTIIFTFYFLYVPDVIVRENNNIIKNWARGLILDIKLVSDVCPFGYEATTLGKFNKISNGYHIGYSYQKYNYTQTAEINYQFFSTKQIGGYEIDGIPTQFLYVWRNSLICVLRSEPEMFSSEKKNVVVKSSYHRNYIVQPYESCPENLLKCPHPLDSLNQYMCVLDLFECGINYIQVVDANFENYDKTKLKKLNFGDGIKSLLVGRGVPGLPPVIEFKIAKGEVCSLPTETWAPQNKTYFLDEFYPYANECATKIAGYSYNPFYTKLDSDKQINVYNYSPNLVERISELLVFPKKYLEDQDMSLFFTSYIGFQNFCNFQKNKEFTIIFENFSSGIASLIIIEFISLPIVFCIFCLLSMTEVADSEEILPLTLCIFIISSFLAIPMVIISWILFNSNKDSFSCKFLFEKYVSNSDFKCFDRFHTSLLENQNIQISYFFDFFLLVTLISTVMLLILFCTPCFTWLGEKVYDMFRD